MNDDLFPIPPIGDQSDFRVDDVGEPLVDPMPTEPTDAPEAPEEPRE